jgi:hypothetical protein
VLAQRYLEKLLANKMVARYLRQHQPEVLEQFEKIVSTKSLDKERVRQRIARALFHEYGISVDDMEPDFKVKVEESGKSSNKKIDIAIFEPGSEHTAENVRRLVVCQKELKLGDKGAYKMRDHEQAAKDLELLKGAMAACENCKYGLWTNGLEFFFFQSSAPSSTSSSTRSATGRLG